MIPGQVRTTKITKQMSEHNMTVDYLIFFVFFFETGGPHIISDKFVEVPARREARATNCCCENFLFERVFASVPFGGIPFCCMTFCNGTLSRLGSWCGISPDATRLRKSSMLLCDPVPRPSSALSWENPVADSNFLIFSGSGGQASG